MFSIRIIENFPDKCPDCRKSFEPASNLPEIWVEKALNILDERFNGININGYMINFKEEKVVNVTLKKEFVGNFKKNENIERELTEFVKKYVRYHDKTFKKYILLSSILNVPFYFILFPHMFPNPEFDFRPNQKMIYIYEVTALNNVYLKHQFDINDLEHWLNMEKDFKFNSNKPLDYADMYLSCYVSKNTTNQLPGDIDYCVFFKSTVAFIFEFKTHNLNKPIENENISNYKEQDFRRFNVYKHLLKQLRSNQKYTPIFVYLVWGTNINLDNHRNIRMDFFKYKNNQMNLVISKTIEHPEISGSINNFVEALKSAISAFKQNDGKENE